MSRDVTVVVGASSGIGRRAAQLLAERGDRLVLASRSAETLEQVRAECEERGAEVLVVVTDISRSADVDRLMDAAVDRFGRVDRLVHSAAVLAYGRFLDVPRDVFDRILATNVHGLTYVARAALRVFERQGAGRLVVVGSVVGTIAVPLMSSYVVSKWAMAGLVRTLQIEARRMPGVDISLVAPGSVDTPIYHLAGSYAGFAGRPPPPVGSADKVARAVVRALDRPRRSVSVGLSSPVMLLGFRLLPRVYDLLVLPLMELAGLSRTRVRATAGNVFAPRPGLEAVEGHWRRRRLRRAGG